MKLYPTKNKFVLIQTRSVGTNLSTSTNVCSKKLALVTSFWAKAKASANITEHPHRSEIESALVLNIISALFDDIHILLDGSHDSYDCLVLKQNLQDRIALTQTNSSKSRISCVEIGDSQPNYFQMFEYTNDTALSGSIIIMANADMVFDHTAIHLTMLANNSANTIATQGFQDGRHPPELLQTQLRQLGLEPSKMAITNRCYASRTRSSWDAYVFHYGTLSFDFKDFREQSGRSFTMNTMGAENAALYYLTKASPNITFRQICDHVHIWHIHATAKTYVPKKKSVRGARAIAASCANIKECLGISETEQAKSVG